MLDTALTDGTVILRAVEVRDGPAVLAALSSDRTVSRWTRVPWPYTSAHLDEFMRAIAAWHSGRTDVAVAIVDAASDEFLGCMGLHRVGYPQLARSAFLPDEVGYWVKASARGRGVATRALRLVSVYAIDELQRPLLNLQTKVGNDASVTVARRVGYRFSARVLGRDVDDDDVDHDRFVLTAADLAAAVPIESAVDPVVTPHA
jgi:RimJ/RimL family protein N-acetyltransferase